MASKTEKTILEASMGRYMRVIRNHNTLEELIAAYPSLKEKCLSCPSALTDEERRVFLDLPDLDMETANIRAATALSRAEFWTPKTGAERKVTWELLCETEEIIMGEEGAAFYASRNPAFLPNELEAFQAGSREWHGRPTRARKMQASAMAEAALSDAPEWIRRLYREGKDLWGRFSVSLGGFVKFALKHNGSRDIIDTKWYMIPFNALGSAVVAHASVAGTALDASNKSSQQNDVILRRAFREILQDPLQYEQRADVAPRTLFGGQCRADLYKDGIQ
ncbi:uncharacterized protein EAE97_003259 [Botrytis byssoidea]|uniref:Uncharacterized protein n=1 Tax=Botrytis byssoidea TaxID=139641 RepID=A0A9P5IQ39_9HELO|nr:uncharacterized protein EAE97_003259 [Botrytis byssoidea]KAF7949750.1 hypothetical protein EAE97_003259 [Botrytis byssoidea]